MNTYLSFSDGAKFADIARNLIDGFGYVTKFSFWSNNLYYRAINGLFSGLSIPPVMPFSIAFFFKLFGVNDFAVIATSFFYFILTMVFVFLLAKKVFDSNLIGALSTFAVGFNYDLINYATSGASESPFIFEIVAASYFISIKKKWGTVVAFLLLVLMYFTRPQAFIYIAGEILFYLITRFKIKKAIIVFLAISVLALLVDRYYLWGLTRNSFFYSVSIRGLQATSQYSIPNDAVSNALRGETVSTPVVTQGVASISPILNIIRKVLYNLYNFFKLMPQIMNPYLFALFVIGLFRWTKNKVYNSFKTATIFMFLATLLVTALSIPFFRYIHPIVPLIYIIAIGTLVELISNFHSGAGYVFPISKRILLVFSCSFLVFLFGVGQTLGVLLLDSRFERDTHNVGKPPVYVALSHFLKDNTNINDIVVTNLDTWGSWYGERKTVWFPIEPKQLIDSVAGKISFDAIYLTSYLIDDENYYMGAGWREIFNNPNDSSKWICDGCKEIAKEFKLKGIYTVPSNTDYERQDAKAMLLVKK